MLKVFYNASIPHLLSIYFSGLSSPYWQFGIEVDAL